MSVMKLSKPKSHLKNKCTIIKINDNGYPKENNYEKIFSQSHSTRNEKRFLLKQSTLYPSFQIMNKKKFLENIEKGKYEIESFDELFRKEKFRRSVKIESYKKKTFDNINFDYILNNYNNQNVNSQKLNDSLIENLKKKELDKELSEINNLNLQRNQTQSSLTNSINMENIELDKPIIERIAFKHKKNNNQSPLSKSNSMKKNIYKQYQMNNPTNYINTSNNLTSSNNSINKLFNSTASINSNPGNNNSINLSLLSSISNPNKKKYILNNFYFLVPQEEIEEGRKNYYYKSYNEKIQYNEDYIKQFKNWKISNENKLLTDEVLNHLDKMKIYEKIKNDNNDINELLISENNQNDDYENTDEGKLTLEDLSNENKERHLDTLLNEINNSKNEIEDKVRIDEYDTSNSKITFNNNSIFNTPYSNFSINESNKIKKQTPLLKSSKPYFPSSLKLQKKINESNINNNNNNNTNKKENSDKNTEIKNNESIKESEKKDKDSNIESNNLESSENKENKNILSNPLILIEDNNEKEPGNLYNQIISEENENEENSEKKKKSRKNTVNSRHSEEYNNWADAPVEDEEEEIELNNFRNEINRDIIKCDLRELLNIISINNYQEVKKKIKNIIKENSSGQEKLVDILFIKAIYEPYFQPLYAKLCAELDKFLMNKKETIKSPFRLKIIDNCQKNFVSLKKSTNNKNYVLGNVSFIAELINSQLISKKGGTQCIRNLLEKFETFSKEDTSIDNRIQIKYLYLESVIIFLEKFATGLMNHHKEYIRDYKDEILKDMNVLKNIYNDKKHNDMPSYLRYKLLNLIEKEKNNWKPYIYENLNQIQIDKIQKNRNHKEEENNNLSNSSNNLNFNNKKEKINRNKSQNLRSSKSNKSNNSFYYDNYDNYNDYNDYNEYDEYNNYDNNRYYDNYDEYYFQYDNSYNNDNYYEGNDEYYDYTNSRYYHDRKNKSTSNLRNSNKKKNANSQKKNKHETEKSTPSKKYKNYK